MQKSLTDLVEADYEEIKKLAALFFTPREVAIMLELPPSEFILECEWEGPVYKAFYGGRLQAEVDFRTSIIKLSNSGSSPAQTMVKDLLTASQAKMLDR